MKKLIYIIICVIAAWSCSDVSESERFEYVKLPDVNRNVLLEDYTGQRCVNCPEATAEIHKIQEMYGEEHVIAVAIHGGPLAFASTAKYLGLRSDLADTYYNAANITQNPMGVINRSGSPIIPDLWQSAVSEAIQKTAPVDIFPTALIVDNKIKVVLRVLAIENNTTGKLQAWIVEDGITAMQLTPDKPKGDTEYIHNHVLRAAVNGDWGEDISLAEGSTKSFEYEIAIDDSWNPDKLSAVAFVYNADGVQQVVKAKVYAQSDVD